MQYALASIFMKMTKLRLPLNCKHMVLKYSFMRKYDLGYIDTCMRIPIHPSIHSPIHPSINPFIYSPTHPYMMDAYSNTTRSKISKLMRKCSDQHVWGFSTMLGFDLRWLCLFIILSGQLEHTERNRRLKAWCTHAMTTSHGYVCFYYSPEELFYSPWRNCPSMHFLE